jgi:very long chain acyl-CoA dehydrogenase
MMFTRSILRFLRPNSKLFSIRLASTSPSPSIDHLPSFSRALFKGDLASSSIFPYPTVSLTSSDLTNLTELVSAVEVFSYKVNDPSLNDKTSSIPAVTRTALKELGAYGLQIPESFGGIGLNNSQYGRLTEVLGSDLGVAIHLGAHQSIGFKGLLLFGNDEQKKKYLPSLASGESVAAFSLTEPGSGSDANSVKARAEQQKDGSWLLNGSKLWTTNGGEAKFFTVFAQTSIPDDKAPGGKKDAMTAFIVERAFGGVTSGPPEKKMGIRCSNTTTVNYDNVPVPKENVIGGVGNGFKVAVSILNNGRFGMATMLTGTMKVVIKAATEHVLIRRQFGRTLSSFEAVKGKLASMNARCYATESFSYMLAANMDAGQKEFAIEAAIAKVFASEAAYSVTYDAMQLVGGASFMIDLPYERILRDLRIYSIFEGANDILRLLIAGQGLSTLGKSLKEKSSSVSSSTSSTLGIFAKIGFAQLGLSQGQSFPQKDIASPLREHARIIEKQVAEFSVICVQLLMKHGKTVTEQQILLQRAADVVIDISVATATISRASRAFKENESAAAADIALCELFCIEAGVRTDEALSALREDGLHKKVVALKNSIAKSVFDSSGYPKVVPPVGV